MTTWPEGNEPGGTDLQDLLEGLPFAGGPAEAEVIRMQGLLVRSEPGLVRIVVGRLAFSVAERDVLEASPRMGAGSGQGAVLCDVVLRCGAGIAKVEPWAEFEHICSGVKRPFALATRSRSIVIAPEQTFRALEALFLQEL